MTEQGRSVPEAVLMPVHGGAAAAEVKAPIECNYYCRGGQHCDLVYWDGETLPPSIAAYTMFYTFQPRQHRVVRVEPATEAGPCPPWFFNRDAHTKPWLVFWEKVA